MPNVTIYTDGSSRGNPGPGGYGALLRYVDQEGNVHEKELSAGYRLTTNNRMELMGAIVALENLKAPCSVTLISDSQYVIKAFNEGWIQKWKTSGWKGSNKKPVKNIDLWMRLEQAMAPHQINFEWVHGHAGHTENERCDELATSAADSSDLLIDEAFENELNLNNNNSLF